jgi:tryptophan 2,3-dioxygenase
MMSIAELESWLQEPTPRRFPYDAVVREYQRIGKHFVSADLRKLLATARDRLPAMRGPWADLSVLASFLDSVLDKTDGRYDYPTYLALPMLQLPPLDDPVERAPFARPRCDRLLVQLISDAASFELAALDGVTTRLPKMRPSRDLVVLRCKHGLRAISPALARMSLDGALTATDPVDKARQVSSLVTADMSLAERQAMQLSLLPVYTSHDEYMFLRVLQTFETTFVLLAMHLRGAVAALAERATDRAIHFVSGAETTLRESAPLFSMLATMQVESFRTFREFTEGASAIQSRGYKLVESLCRQPDQDRVDSPAFYSVPEIRQRVLAGQATLDDAYREACDSGDLDGAEQQRMDDAMGGFARALMRWRNTHYRLALRMLGTSTGTGYTEGTPYLASVRDIPVFHSVDPVGESTGSATAGQR